MEKSSLDCLNVLKLRYMALHEMKRPMNRALFSSHLPGYFFNDGRNKETVLCCSMGLSTVDNEYLLEISL